MNCQDVLIFSFTKHSEKGTVQVKVIIILSCSNNQNPIWNKRYRWELWFSLQWLSKTWSCLTLYSIAVNKAAHACVLLQVHTITQFPWGQGRCVREHTAHPVVINHSYYTKMSACHSTAPLPHSYKLEVTLSNWVDMVKSARLWSVSNITCTCNCFLFTCSYM